MNRSTLTLTLACACLAAAGTALGEPQKLDKAQLDKVVAGKIEQVNNGGQTPNGNALGVPAQNPAGHQPPGQQPTPGQPN